MRGSMRVAAAALALFGSAVGSLASSPAWGAAAIQELKLSNGSPLLGAVDSGPPRQLVIAIYETGCKALPKGHRGAASLLEYIALEGPVGKTQAEYRREQFLINASVGISLDGRGLLMIASAPPQHLEAALRLSSELVRKPKLLEQPLQVARQRAIVRRRAQQQDMRFLTDLVAQRTLYPGHPDAYSCISNVKELESLGLEALQSDWTTLTDPTRVAYASVGPMPLAQVRKLIESTLINGSKAAYQAPASIAPATFPKPSSPGGTDVILLEQPGVADNQVAYIWPQTLTVDTPDFAQAEVALTLLGNGFAGRLMQELREKRGLTYGAYAGLSASLPQYASASFAGNDKVGRLIKELPEVYRDFVAEKQTEERVGIAKETLVTEFRQYTELPQDGFFIALTSRFFGRDPNAWRGRPERWAAVSTASLEQFIKQRLNSKPSYLVVVGDPQVLRPALEQAGYAKESIKTVSADEL